jgi:CDP-diacylglycerol---serine O-phosphatidyltransferase
MLNSSTNSEAAIKRVYLLPNIITTFGLACGLFVIFKMAMLQPGAASYPIVQACTLLLLLAATADVLDGAIARLMRAESEFGVIFDCLSDAITFGVAPAVVMLKSLNLPSNTKLSLLASTAAMLFAICGVLRLARFSAKRTHQQPREPRSEKPWERVAEYRIFTGLPIPAAASAAVSATLLLIAPEVQALLDLSTETRAIISIVAMVILGYFMISRWKFPGIKVLHLRVQSFHLVFLTVILAIVLFYGILFYFPVVFVVVAWGYLLTAWILSLVRVIAGRRSRMLEDFEPAPDQVDADL